MNTSIPKSMLAVLIEENGGPPIVREVPVPRPGPGEVLVRMAAAPINPSDLGFMKGAYGEHRSFPVVPGFEGSGTVVAAGRGLLPRLWLGKRVACSASKKLSTHGIENERGPLFMHQLVKYDSEVWSIAHKNVFRTQGAQQFRLLPSPHDIDDRDPMPETQPQDHPAQRARSRSVHERGMLATLDDGKESKRGQWIHEHHGSLLQRKVFFPMCAARLSSAPRPTDLRSVSVCFRPGPRPGAVDKGTHRGARAARYSAQVPPDVGGKRKSVLRVFFLGTGCRAEICLTC